MKSMNLVRFARGRNATLLTVIGAAVAIGISGCSSSKSSGSGGGSSAAAGGAHVDIVAYSVPKPAYDALEQGFNAAAQGKGAQFSASYGASGTQATAVTQGQKAGYVNFSTGGDMTKLVPKFVDAGWNTGPTKGIVSDSVVVIGVRPGNPKHITGWDDLIKSDVKIVTPDPASSGSAKWNILAAYEHVLQDGGTEEQAQAYLKKFFANVVSKPNSGSTATSTFLNGTGDVLISYESEAIGARQKGQKLDYLVPKDSFLIETPGAVTTSAPQMAKDFLAYVLSDAGQKTFASKGFRPAVSSVAPGTVQGATDPSHPYPTVDKLATISDLGGWSAVNKKYFDPSTGIVTKIEGAG
jgi:sulfate/thiosulfate-binding protein